MNAIEPIITMAGKFTPLAKQVYGIAKGGIKSYKKKEKKPSSTAPKNKNYRPKAPKNVASPVKPVKPAK